MAQYLDTTGLKTFWNKIKSNFLSISGGKLTGELEIDGNYALSISGNNKSSIVEAGSTTTLSSNGSISTLTGDGVSLSCIFDGDTVNDAWMKKHFIRWFSSGESTALVCTDAKIIALNVTQYTALVMFTLQWSNSNPTGMYLYVDDNLIDGVNGGDDNSYYTFTRTVNYSADYPTIEARLS